MKMVNVNEDFKHEVFSAEQFKRFGKIEKFLAGKTKNKNEGNTRRSDDDPVMGGAKAIILN